MIYDLIALLLPTKTVDGALRAIRKAAAALEAAEKAQLDRAKSLRESAAATLAQAAEAENEAARAARVRDNFSQLTA